MSQFVKYSKTDMVADAVYPLKYTEESGAELGLLELGNARAMSRRGGDVAAAGELDSDSITVDCSAVPRTSSVSPLVCISLYLRSPSVSLCMCVTVWMCRCVYVCLCSCQRLVALQPLAEEVVVTVAVATEVRLRCRWHCLPRCA